MHNTEHSDGGGNVLLSQQSTFYNFLLFFHYFRFQFSVLSFLQFAASSDLGGGRHQLQQREVAAGKATYPSPRQTCELCLTLHI